MQITFEHGKNEGSLALLTIVDGDKVEKYWVDESTEIVTPYKVLQDPDEVHGIKIALSDIKRTRESLEQILSLTSGPEKILEVVNGLYDCLLRIANDGIVESWELGYYATMFESAEEELEFYLDNLDNLREAIEDALGVYQWTIKDRVIIENSGWTARRSKDGGEESA